jgi:hypothetical protein
MAGWGQKIGRTGPGLWLWRITRQSDLATWAVGEASWAVSAIGHALARRKPAHQAHDRAQRATLAAFEAETRAGRRG